MLANFSGWHALIILVVILLLFGAPKLPALARSLGQSMKILKNEVRPESRDGEDDETATPSASTNATVSSVDATKAKKPGSESATG